MRGEDPVGYDKIDRIYKHLRSDPTILRLQESGAGSVLGDDQTRRVRQIVSGTSVSPKYGRLLSRLVHSIKPSTIIELGTGAGISTMYMAIACDHCKVYSIEGNPEIAGLAERNIISLNLTNTEIFAGSFSEILPGLLQNVQHPLLIFIDGDHRGQQLMRYFETMLPYTDENTILVLDDIRWSVSMEVAWKEIIKRPEVSVSIDLFRMGILFLKKNIHKQNHVIKF